MKEIKLQKESENFQKRGKDDADSTRQTHQRGPTHNKRVGTRYLRA